MAESESTQTQFQDKSAFELICDLCRLDDLKVVAVKYCVKCMNWLCDSCLKRHTNNPVFKTHKTVDKDGLPLTITPQILQTLRDSIFCGTHEIQLEYMCNDHMELICQMCLRKKHRNCNQISQLQTTVKSVLNEVQHKRTHLQIITERQKEQIHTISEEHERQKKLRSSIVTDLLDFLKRFDETDDKSKFETEVQVAHSVLQKYENIALLQDKDEHLLQAVLFLNDDEKSSVVATHVQLSLCQNKLVDSDFKSNFIGMPNRLEDVKSITTELVNIDLSKDSKSSKPLRTYKDASVQTHRIEYTSTSAETYRQPDDAVSGARQSETKQNEMKYNESKTSLKDKCDSNASLLKRTLKFDANYNVCLTGETECCISGIVVLNDGRIVAADSSNRSLKMFTSFLNGQFVHKLKWRPVDLCAIDADKDIEQVAVSLNHRRVEIYAIHADTIIYLRGFDMSLYSRGICHVAGTTIAILVSDKESFSKHVLFPGINSTKNTISIQFRNVKDGRINSYIDVFNNELRSPVYIIPDNKNNIVIGEKKQVSAFNTNGDRLWFYRGHGDRTIDDILGMAIDPEGNIYMCGGGSDNIHQVSSSNLYKNRIVLHDISSPCSIAYDPIQERLIVGCKKRNEVYVYRFV